MKYENIIFDRLASLFELGVLGSCIIIFLAALVPLFILRKICSISKKHDTQNYNKGVRGLEAIPTARPLYPTKFIGNMPILMPFSETLNTMERLSKENGEIFKFIGINQTFVVLVSGPLVQSLLKSTDYGHNTKEPIVYNPMRPFIKNGLLVSKGPFWKGQRKILTRTQNFSSLKAYMPILNKYSKELIKELQILFADGAQHQISALISTTFLKIISEMICGYEVECASEFMDYHRNFKIWEEYLVKRIFNPPLFFDCIWNIHPASRQNARVVEALSAFAKKRIFEHREKRSCSAEAYNPPNSAPPFRSVLDELIDEGVDDDQIVDEVNTLMFGGHDTGASAIHFFCFAMAVNPQIQQTCQKEIDQLFQNQQDVELHFECVQSELKYLERCIMETLRLFPPVFIFVRRLCTPIDIEGPEGTIRLPSGTSAVVIPYVTHRKEEYYPDPNKFDPDRFLPEEQAKRHPYTYLPFSAGSRNCLGMKFAMMEMKTIAAHILRNFDISSTDKMGEIPLLPFTTLAPQRDYMFNFKRRFAK